MLQTLLAERFHLVVHSEEKLQPAYTLVLAKFGPKLQPSETAILTEQRCVPGQGDVGVKHIQCRHMTTAMLAGVLQEQSPREVDAPVVDQTGLTGAFDFKLDWAPAPRTADAPADPLPGPTIFEAVESQLGLKLESKKLPLPIIVIDRVDRVPTGN
jgi:uncharacterized protein (TIGR03435 family)